MSRVSYAAHYAGQGTGGRMRGGVGAGGGGEGEGGAQGWDWGQVQQRQVRRGLRAGVAAQGPGRGCRRALGQGQGRCQLRRGRGPGQRWYGRGTRAVDRPSKVNASLLELRCSICGCGQGSLTSCPALCPPAPSASKPPLKLIECRRSRTLNAPPPPPNTRGGTLGARPHSKSRHLALGPSGRVVWSAGKTSLALWAAYSGDFLGSMSPGEPQGGDEGGEWENTTKINPATVGKGRGEGRGKGIGKGSGGCWGMAVGYGLWVVGRQVLVENEVCDGRTWGVARS